MIAHAAGLPVEELLAQLAAGAAGGAVALTLLRERARSWARAVRRRRLRAAGAALAALVLALAWSGTALADGGTGPPTITASFSDGCRDVVAHASKEISYVKLRYADGRVVTDRTTNSPDYSLDGGPGDELESAILRAGRTTETFACPGSSGPPTALLEMRTPPLESCRWFPFPQYPTCLTTDARTAWSRPAAGELAFIFFAPYATTFSFRGTSSTDPDDDIASWSIDFGDGASASGGWSTAPPVEVTHTYASPFFGPAFTTVELTVTDAAGQSDSDTLALVGIDGSPD